MEGAPQILESLCGWGRVNGMWGEQSRDFLDKTHQRNSRQPQFFRGIYHLEEKFQIAPWH